MTRSRTSILLSLMLVLLLAGCATTRQTRSAETSGFLGDYSQLRAGQGDEAHLIFINPGVTWSGYDAVMLDSVTLWKSADDSDIADESAQQLTDHLYQALHDELSKSFRIADAPGPGVLRLRAALTEAKGARVVGNAVTSIVPQARLVSTLLGAATDVQIFVGRASAEVEVTDAISGERLLAGVDQRSGTKALRGGLAKWSDVKLACDYWAVRVRERLVALGVKRTD